MQNLTLTLQDTGASGGVDGFNLSAYKLGAAQNVTVNGGGEDVYLGSLGTAGSNGTPDLTLNATNVAGFSVRDMGVGLGYNIDANISASGDVKLGNITSSTNAQSNYQGDVNLTVSGANVLCSADPEADLVFTGGELNIDFSGVTGGVGRATKYGLILNAMEGINYTGAAGDDLLYVGGVGANGYSTINTGGGKDSVVFQANSLVDGSAVTVNLGSGTGDSVVIGADAVATGDTATVNVICGEGADTISIVTSTGGKRIVNVEGFDRGDGDAISGFSAVLPDNDPAVAARYINDTYGMNLATNGEMISVGSSASKALLIGDTAYLVDTVSSPSSTLVVLHGVEVSNNNIDIS